MYANSCWSIVLPLGLFVTVGCSKKTPEFDNRAARNLIARPNVPEYNWGQDKDNESPAKEWNENSARRGLEYMARWKLKETGEPVEDVEAVYREHLDWCKSLVGKKVKWFLTVDKVLPQNKRKTLRHFIVIINGTVRKLPK
jgi:hypothetical protein